MVDPLALPKLERPTMRTVQARLLTHALEQTNPVPGLETVDGIPAPILVRDRLERRASLGDHPRVVDRTEHKSGLDERPAPKLELLEREIPHEAGNMRPLRTAVPEVLVPEAIGGDLPSVTADAADLFADVMVDAALAAAAFLELPDPELAELVPADEPVLGERPDDVVHRAFSLAGAGGHLQVVMRVTGVPSRSTVFFSQHQSSWAGWPQSEHVACARALGCSIHPAHSSGVSVARFDAYSFGS